GASWCVPCQTSLPRLQQLQRQHADAGLQLLVVAQEGSDDLPGTDFRVVVDREGQSQRPPWSVRVLPTELLIDRRGVVRYRHEGEGPDSLEKIAAEAQQLLSELR